MIVCKCTTERISNPFILYFPLERNPRGKFNIFIFLYTAHLSKYLIPNSLFLITYSLKYIFCRRSILKLISCFTLMGLKSFLKDPFFSRTFFKRYLVKTQVHQGWKGFETQNSFYILLTLLCI